VQPDALGRPPPPFAGDQFEICLLARERPHQKGLEDALFPDRLRERIELGLGEPPPRLKCPRLDQLDRDAARRGRV